MSDPWDAMLEADDAELVAEIRADIDSYAVHFGAGNITACAAIEMKYGLIGLSPQQVSEQLNEMIGGAA